MNDTVQIRRAGRDEIYQIAAFLDECWRTSYRRIISDDFLDTMSVKSRYRILVRRFDEGASDFLMMLDGNDLIGSAIFGKSFTAGFEGDGEVSALYLRGDYVGKGYGHVLYMKIEQGLLARGFRSLVLDVLTGNVRAVRFYLAHGFKQTDERYIRLGGVDYPLVVMRKASQ